MTTQKGQSRKKSARDLKNVGVFPENLAEGLKSRTECCWDYICIYENTHKKLPQLIGSRKGAVGA